MRLRQVLLIALVAFLIVLPSSLAAGAKTSRLLVSVRATVTKQWSYSTSRTVAGCSTKVSANGTRTIKLRTSDVSVVTANWPGGRARVKFAGKVRFLAGVVEQVGSKTTTRGGPTGCESGKSQADCAPVTRSFRNRSATIVSRRAHLLTFGALKGLVPGAFFGSCPGEPSAIRSVTGGLELADAKFSEKQLFDRTVAGVTLAGGAEITTQLLNGSARVLQRVHWTLTLRRLGA
jgi:hypothetical protein